MIKLLLMIGKISKHDAIEPTWPSNSESNFKKKSLHILWEYLRNFTNVFVYIKEKYGGERSEYHLPYLSFSFENIQTWYATFDW